MTQDSQTPSPSAQLQAARRRGLGRGLDALFENAPKATSTPAPAASGTEDRAGINAGTFTMPATGPLTGAPVPQTAPSLAAPAPKSGRMMLSLSALQPGKFQPRQAFVPASIDNLSKSIAQHGVLQPLVVRPLKDKAGTYEIIAGERRWRAAQKAGVHDVPVVINDQISDQDALEIGLIENLQREDLNPIDEAAGYQRLIDEFHLTVDILAELIGKSRAHVANTIRLLQLPAAVRGMVSVGTLSAGHARALIGLPDAEGMARSVAEKGLSVRQVEKMAAQVRESAESKYKAGRKAKKTPSKDQYVVVLEQNLSDAIGLKVTVDLATPQSGVVHIEFKNLDQLDLITGHLRKN